jgi:hypothetical protein
MRRRSRQSLHTRLLDPNAPLSAPPAPAGPCTICLTDMEADAHEQPLPAAAAAEQQHAAKGSPAPLLTKLPCYHSFHT